MRAYKTTVPTGHVYWVSVGSADMTGTYSGYNPLELTSITVDYTTTAPVSQLPGNIPVGSASGDLSGTYPSPVVVALQSRSVSGSSPTDGYVLTWDNADGYWVGRPATGGAPSGSAGGDLSGTYPNPTVTKIQSQSISSFSPSDGYILTWDNTDGYWVGRPSQIGLPAVSNQQYAVVMENPAGTPVFSRLTEDMILPTYLISLSLSGSSILEVSNWVNQPNFTASYNRTPSTAVLTDNDGNPSKDVISTPTSFHSDGYFQKFTFNASVVFTLTSSDGNVNKTTNATLTWGQKTYWGIGPAGQNSASFIQSLAGSNITTTQPMTFSVTAGATDKVYFASRAAYGTPTFTVGVLSGGFNLVSNTISITNAYGFTENYQLWESTNVNLGSITVQVS